MSAYSSDSDLTVELNGCDAPKVQFKCRPHSHPFNERQLIVTDTVKIGRSVAKSKPADNNAIFDCKVLSRNHAVLWYEDSRFWLKDTKSSNGTFVNNQRLGKGNEESQPRDIYSGDIIQFGVDVMENSKKVTHGCIIAQVALYYADGQEAKRPSTGQMLPAGAAGSTAECISQEQVYQLSQYLQEALHREQLITARFDKFKELLDSVSAMNETSWSAVLNEERLLSRLELMEDQLALSCAKPDNNNDVQDYLLEAVAKKAEAEEALKSKLEEYLAEKSTACQRLAQLERSYQECQEECDHLRDTCDKAREQMQQLSAQYDKDTAGLRDDLVTANKENQSLMQQVKELSEVLVDQNFEQIDSNAQSDQQQGDQQLQVDVINQPAVNADLCSAEVQTDFADSQQQLRTEIQTYKELLEEQQKAQDISSNNVENLHRQLESALAQIKDLESKLTAAQDTVTGSKWEQHMEDGLPLRSEADWLLSELQSLSADSASIARTNRLLASVTSLLSNGNQLPADENSSASNSDNNLIISLQQENAELTSALTNAKRLKSDTDNNSVIVGDVELQLMQQRYAELEQKSNNELATYKQQLHNVTDRNRLITAAALLPLFVLLLSVTVSVYTWLTGQ